jgi:V/A-type H+-transporting ATPase subunit E
LKKGIELKPFPELQAGFRIAMKDGSAYYNFSDQGIAEILAEYMNPRIAEIVQEAVEEES